MGELLKIENEGGTYYYQLPDVPDKEDILFHEYPKLEQYWRIPPRKKISQLNEFEKIEYIQEERRRWLDGVWFMNKGVPTYITGMHYDHMVNMHFPEFEGGKAKYFDQQRIDFYMRDLARKDKNCFGILWLKPRRYGMTAEEITQCTYTAMEDFGSKVSVMSDEGTKAKTTLLHPIIDSFIKRPIYCRPTYYHPNGKKPRTSLEFVTDSLDDEAAIEEDNDTTLGGGIWPCLTTPAANDGKKRRYITMDETWKWKVASPEETFGINKKCVEDGGIKGKISVLSTMGDSDSYANAIQEGIKMWYASNPEVRDENGRTTSGLYRFFVSAIHSKALPLEFTDKYGFVDEKKATQFVLNDLAKFDKSTKEYVYEQRRMPLKVADALSTADTKALFSRARINERLKELGDLPPILKPYVIGNLVGPDVNGKVTFEPDPLGKWKMAIQPYTNNLTKVNAANRFTKRGADYFPPVNPEGVVGYDPVRYADTTSDSISRAAIIVKSKFDYFSPDGSLANRYRALYVDRPEDPRDADLEFIKACLFFGYLGMTEAQVERVEKTMREEHMIAFMMKSADGKRYGTWTDNNKKVIKAGVDLKQAYWKLPKADAEGNDAIDYLKLCPFEDVLLDSDTVDIAKTTKSDVFMCEVMCDHGLLQLKFTIVTEKQTTSVKTIMKSLTPSRN